MRRRVSWVLMSSVLVLGCSIAEASSNKDSSPQPKAPFKRYVAPEPEFSFEEVMALRELLLNGNYELLDEQLKSIQEAYERDPLEDNTWVLRSIFNVSDLSLATYLEEWVTLMPDSYSAHLARGMYFATKGWDARDSRFIRLTSDEQLRKMRRWFDAAKAELLRALEINPRLEQAFSRLISIETALGDRESALHWLTVALELNPYSYFVRWAYLGSLEPRWGGSLSEIEAFANEALPYAEKRPRLILLQGYLYAELGRQKFGESKEEALALHDKALSYGDSAWYLFLKADTLYMLSRYEEAIEVCSRILEISPIETMAREVRSKSYYYLGREDEALRDIEMALSIDPGDMGILIAQAFVHQQEGRFDDSLSTYERALAVRPYSRRLWADKGKLLIDMERYGEAEEALQRALVLNPESAETRYYLGLLMKKRGDAEGENFLRSALYLDDDGFYHAELGSRYGRGSLVEENQTIAMHWLVKAAQMGNRYAESETGRRFLVGEGTSKNYRAAHDWLLSAAERGERTAMNRVGLMYERGLEVYQDHKKAALWYWKSAKAGNIHGRYNLGTVYESGLGVGKDLITAYLLTKAAASEDDEDAAKFLPRIQAQMTREQLADAERRLCEGETGLEKALAEPETSLDPSRHKIEDMAPPKATKTTTNQIAFLRLTTGQWQIWIMGPDGSDARQLTHSQIDKVHAAWRPGTSEILYGTAGGHNYLLDVESGEERPVLEGLSTKKVSWSPDGNRLAYVIRSDSHPKRDLWITDVEGRHRKEVLTNVNIEAPPAWLNDDVLIHRENATYMNVGEKNQFWELAIDLDGAQRRVPYDEEPLKLDLDVVSVPNEWSDTGSTWNLAYSSLRSGFYEIWAYDLVDKWPRQVTRLQAYAGAPSWSPDGRFLTFDSDKAGTLQIYRVNEDGEELVQLTKGETPSRQPTWSR